MLAEADLAKVECKKNTDGTYQDEHPEFDAGAKRYCTDLLMDPSVDVNSWYEVRVGPNSWDRQRFLEDQATSAYVVFTPPTRLYDDVWDETKYGSDAGKTISLDYQGFGELHGLTGEVIDTRTGALRDVPRVGILGRIVIADEIQTNFVVVTTAARRVLRITLPHLIPGHPVGEMPGQQESDSHTLAGRHRHCGRYRTHRTILMTLFER